MGQYFSGKIISVSQAGNRGVIQFLDGSQRETRFRIQEGRIASENGFLCAPDKAHPLKLVVGAEVYFSIDERVKFRFAKDWIYKSGAPEAVLRNLKPITRTGRKVIPENTGQPPNKWERRLVRR